MLLLPYILYIKFEQKTCKYYVHINARSFQSIQYIYILYYAQPRRPVTAPRITEKLINYTSCGRHFFFV